MKQNNYSFTDIYFSERWMSLKNLPNEEWMDIKGYEGIYMVSNMGRVKVLDRLVTHVNYSKIKESHILSPNITGSGIKVYLGIHLWLNGNRKCKKIHRLVAEHFIDNPEKLPCINHKNEDKFDNRVENLEWCTYSYNNTYNNLKERTWTRRINKASMSYPVFQYDNDMNLVAEYPSYSDIASKKTHIYATKVINDGILL